jgi:ProQ/FINO family
MRRAAEEAGAAASTALTGQSGDFPKGDASTNSKPWADAAILLRTVAELWPIFTADSWRSHRALAIGIDAQLVASGVVKGWEANALLRLYTRRRCYVAAVAAGGYRYNLDGSVAGEIAVEHIACAKGSLTGMDERAAKSTAVAKAARVAEREKREAEQAAAGHAFVAARRAERKAAETSKGPAPYHKAHPEITRPAPPQRAGDGLAALKRAAIARRLGEVSPCR